MTWANLPFIGPTYSGRSTDINASRCINLYPEVDQSSTKSVVTLHGTPGLAAVQTVGTGPHRGAINFVGDAYFVSGDELIRLNEDRTTSSIGTLNTNDGPVSMATSGSFGNEIMIVDGTDGYIFDGATFSVISDLDFPVFPETCAYMDSFFLVSQRDSAQFNISGVLDGTSWDALDFATAERDPDDLKQMVVNHRELWLFGTDTTEVWWNSGNADFPFEVIPNGFLEWGILAPFSAAKVDNSIFFLSQDPRGQAAVVRTKGFQVENVTPPMISERFRQLGDISDATAYTYQQAGHYFYVLNFTNANETWVYDTTTQMWHERKSRENEVDNRHRGEVHVFNGGQNLIGDFETGQVFEYDLDTFQDGVETIVRERTGRHVHQHRKNLLHHTVEIEVESGVGILEEENSSYWEGDYVTPESFDATDYVLPPLVPAGFDPLIGLDFSDDGGHTYGNRLFQSMGKTGEFLQRARWNGLGLSRDRIYRVQISDPVKVIIVDAVIDAEECFY